MFVLSLGQVSLRCTDELCIIIFNFILMYAVLLPDPSLGGRERRFRVDYKFYSMKKKDAETYMENLASFSSHMLPFVVPPSSQQPPPQQQPEESPPIEKYVYVTFVAPEL